MTNARSIGYTELIRQNKNFRNLWFGQIVSLLGDWFNLIASATLVETLTGAGVAVGGLLALRALAPFLVAPVAGVFADRYNRKWILIWSDILRGLIMLGFLFVRNERDVWLLFGLTALQFAVSGFFFPTRNAILPDIVQPEEVGAANALSSVTWSVMLAFGTAVGGIISGWLGVYTAFVLDALTFAVSAYFILQIQYVQTSSNSGSKGISHAIGQYIDGLRYLRANPDTLVVATQKTFVSALMFTPLQVVMIALSTRVFVIGQDGGTGLGIMLATIGVGSGIGPIVARRFTGDNWALLRLAIAIAFLTSTIGMVITAPLTGFLIFLFGSFVRGLGSGTIWVFTTQLLLQSVPNQVRGRVFASEFALFTLISSLGALGAGWALDYFAEISTVLWIMTALTLIPLTLWTLWIFYHSEQTGTVTEVAE